MIYPDYDRSILSTTASIMTHYGASAQYPTLPELDALLATGPKHVALIITDGAGVRPLEGALPADSYMRSHIAAVVTSIFPSTTTAATTSYYCGKSALEHGWLGWKLYFKEYATDIITFMRSTYYTKKPVDGPHAAATLMPYETVFDMFRKSAPDVVTRTQYAFDSSCEHGAHERLRISSFSELCDNQARISRSAQRSFTISYWGDPDSTMHSYGVGSKKAVDSFKNIDGELKSLAARVSDTLIIVTADHGLINATEIDIGDFPEIMECLIMPPMIESRAAAFYVKPHMRAEFEERFQRLLGKWFLLMPRAEVYRSGIFGRGKAHPKFDDFIGDYLACAISDKSIEFYAPAIEHSPLIGMHAGLTEDEMLVPVILDRK